MENRERDREQKSGTSAEFGQKIGRSEDLSEGGNMDNRNDKNVNRNSRIENESTRRPDSEGYGSSSSDRKGSMDEQNISGSEPRKDRSSGSLGSNRNSSDSSEGRH